MGLFLRQEGGGVRVQYWDMGCLMHSSGVQFSEEGEWVSIIGGYRDQTAVLWIIVPHDRKRPVNLEPLVQVSRTQNFGIHPSVQTKNCQYIK